MSSIVLITTANNPPKGTPFLEMTNLATRYVTAKAAVFFWSACGIKKIVIADATGGSLLNKEEVLMLNQMDVDVEQISYQQSVELIKSRGKGYGEGELIKFALQKSLLLKSVDNFFKCTGKVYCRNFESIFEIITENKIQNIFWRHLDEGDSINRWADMRFFYTSKKFCEEVLIPTYLKSDDNVAAAEYLFNHVLNEKLETGRALRPMLTGFAGGTGKQYFDLSLGALDTNFPCWANTK